MQNRSSKMKGYFNTLVRNPALKITIFLVGSICGFMVEFGAQKFLLNYFPEYYTNDAQEVIQSLSKHFVDIESLINKLQGELNSEERAMAEKDLNNLLTKASKDNQHLSQSLKAINKEISTLREHLTKEKGIDAGTDLRLHHARGVRIGNFTISANKNTRHIAGRFGISQINSKYRENSVIIRLSSSKGNNLKVLSVGESLNFNKNDTQVCTLGFLAETINGVFDFSLNCLPAKKAM